MEDKIFRSNDAEFEIGYFDNDKKLPFYISSGRGIEEIYLNPNEANELITHLVGCLKEINEPIDLLVDSSKLPNGWISVDDRPLYTIDENGKWTCTEDGCREFIAAVHYSDTKRPDETNLWWIRHCVVVDEIGLCVVTDDDNEPAGWQLEQVSYWMPWVSPPSV